MRPSARIAVSNPVTGDRWLRNLPGRRIVDRSWCAFMGREQWQGLCHSRREPFRTTNRCDRSTGPASRRAVRYWLASGSPLAETAQGPDPGVRGDGGSRSRRGARPPIGEEGRGNARPGLTVPASGSLLGRQPRCGWPPRSHRPALAVDREGRGGCQGARSTSPLGRARPLASAAATSWSASPEVSLPRTGPGERKATGAGARSAPPMASGSGRDRPAGTCPSYTTSDSMNPIPFHPTARQSTPQDSASDGPS